jgi:fumarylacetoacetase
MSWAVLVSKDLDDDARPALRSWVESANDPASDFRSRTCPSAVSPCEDTDWRIGVAIGDHVLDLQLARLIQSYDINRIMGLAREPHRGSAGARSVEGLRTAARMSGVPRCAPSAVPSRAWACRA